MPLPAIPEPSRGGDILPWARNVSMLLRYLIPQVSPDMVPDSTPGGTKWRLNNRSSTPRLSDPSPWQIISCGAGDDGTPKIGAYYFSTVFDDSDDMTSVVAVAGLLTTSDSPGPDDAGAFDLPGIGEKIWLELSVHDPTAITARIAHGAVGGEAWDEYPDPWAVNRDDPGNPYIEFFNLLLAEVTDFEADNRPALLTFSMPDGSTRQVTQMYSRNVLMADWAKSGMVVKAPLDFTLNYPATPL